MKNLILLFILFGNSLVFADAICVKKKLKANKKGVVNLSKSLKVIPSTESCPRGFSRLISTTNLDNTPSCTTKEVGGDFCQEDFYCTTIAECDGADVMESWSFLSKDNPGSTTITSVQSLTDQEYGNPYGVEIVSTNLTGSSGHTPTVKVTCCNS